jgi:hypothetical protein
MNILKLSSYDLLKEITGKSDHDLLLALIKHTFFLAPEAVYKKPVMFPDYVRESKDVYPNKKKGTFADWHGRSVKVCDNNKARDAFGKYSGFKMGGSNRNMPKGWHVTHIWGMVYHPECFTAGWNMCLMPSFFRDLTEEQNSLDYVQKLIKQIAFDLYFKNNKSFQQKFSFIEDLNNQGIDISKEFPNWSPNILK